MGKQLCKELLRFLHSIDETGVALRRTIEDLKIVAEAPMPSAEPPVPEDPPSTETDRTRPPNVRVNSQFELSLPKTLVSPPSPTSAGTVPAAPQPMEMQPQTAQTSEDGPAE